MTAGQVAAIILARGGSKGIPGKNLARVGGLSLLARSVRAARGGNRRGGGLGVDRCCRTFLPIVQGGCMMRQITGPARFSACQIFSLTGTRLTQGNAVECPTLRDAAGVVHSLSYLSPAVALGGRVTVRGVYGITTTCLGTVLVVQQETILPE